MILLERYEQGQEQMRARAGLTRENANERTERYGPQLSRSWKKPSESTPASGRLWSAARDANPNGAKLKKLREKVLRLIQRDTMLPDDASMRKAEASSQAGDKLKHVPRR